MPSSPRILDKGRASLAGKLGEYHFAGKGMDRHFFSFTGLDHESLKKELAKGSSDRRNPGLGPGQLQTAAPAQEIAAAWSEYHLRRTPDSDHETLTEFAGEVKKFNPLREDINTWFDLLDLDDYCSFGGKA